MSAGNVYNVVKRFVNLKGKEIHNLTNSERRIIADLKHEGLL